MTNEKHFVIKDSQGRFNGGIVICSNPETKEAKWEYWSNSKPTHCNIYKPNVQIELQKLQQLNNLADFNLTFEVVEIDRDIMIPSNTAPSNNFSIEYRDIQKGKITAYRKMVREIHKKYKSMVKERVA
ncbi:MAG: hypothetical protein NHB14_19675 [Desulfosporosinus sp.]|nr:hypothetical protein [Desulfosporosinus sp.]